MSFTYYRTLRFLTALFSAILVSCQFPYTPEQEPSVSTENTVSQKIGVFPVNGGKQTCNISISPDTTDFRGCILWLNFSGALVQNVSPELAGYKTFAQQHDRLTITDSSNTVRWFITRDEMGARGEDNFQDPEWSTHPRIIVTLLSSENLQKWNLFAIDLKSRNSIKLCDEKMDEVSTPHLWIPETSTFSGTDDISPEYNSSGFADKNSVRKFFGTSDVKVVFSRKESGSLSLYYVNYNESAVPSKLPRPAGKENWKLESPLISPDGKWVVYNAYQSTRYYESYIQELRPGSVPILIAEGASDPHWWTHPDDRSLQYIVYARIPGDNLVQADLAEPKVQETGSAGSTWMQQVKLFPGRPSMMAVVKTGDPILLVNLPLKGGRSPDGAFFCTGYSSAYIVRLY